MTTIYLKFPDEATAKAKLADYYDASGWNTASLNHSLDPIGVLYNNDGVFNGLVCTTQPTQKVGWFVNFIGILPTSAQPYVINPITPDRIFA